MIKHFRPAFAVLFVTILLFSCLKKESKRDIGDNLKAAMGTYLNHQPRIDTARVKFQVLEVVYFEDKSAYLCEFKVNMKEKTNAQLKDTIGTMGAKISKDFKDVTRTR